MRRRSGQRYCAGFQVLTQPGGINPIRTLKAKAYRRSATRGVGEEGDLRTGVQLAEEINDQHDRAGLAWAKYTPVIHSSYNKHAPDTSNRWGVWLSVTWGREKPGKH